MSSLKIVLIAAFATAAQADSFRFGNSSSFISIHTDGGARGEPSQPVITRGPQG